MDVRAGGQVAYAEATSGSQESEAGLLLRGVRTMTKPFYIVVVAQEAVTMFPEWLRRQDH